jgi:hypothetical protein
MDKIYKPKPSQPFTSNYSSVAHCIKAVYAALNFINYYSFTTTVADTTNTTSAISTNTANDIITYAIITTITTTLTFTKVITVVIK